ncbi:MAG TPA: helix-turn-helix transcriptional regulator [Candidatus Sulfotelmatobacter sp.]|nr:helix-turn-helix transcriptional regulator [Candidatus Sulfotelmatobacter sp.]
MDAHIGGRLRLRRTLMGFSQEKLAEAVGLTFQQIQKYEKGANRIGASRLYQFSNILEVPPSYFFDSMPPELARADGDTSDAGNATLLRDPLTKRETLELVRAYYRIADPTVRRRLFDLVRSLSHSDIDTALNDIQAPSGA